MTPDAETMNRMTMTLSTSLKFLHGSTLHVQPNINAAGTVLGRLLSTCECIRQVVFNRH